VTEYFLIAKVKSIFDELGSVIIASNSDFPERFLKLNKVLVDVFGDKREFIVEKVDLFEKDIIIKFKNFNSDDDVKFLIGKKIFVEAKDAVKLDDDTFYVHDLIGSQVLVNEKFFGHLNDVYCLPANDVYVISDENGNEILIPALKKYVEGFDSNKKILKLKSIYDLYDED